MYATVSIDRCRRIFTHVPSGKVGTVMQSALDPAVASVTTVRSAKHLLTDVEATPAQDLTGGWSHRWNGLSGVEMWRSRRAQVFWEARTSAV